MSIEPCTSFQALLIEQQEGQRCCTLQTLPWSALPAGDVTVRVEYSTLNYKDGLAVSGQAPVVRSYPMVPGIDFAGRVVESSDPRWQVGDAVLLNGWGVGERHWGGLAEYARVNGDWLTRLPEGLSSKEAMAIGTAGYTAMLCVMALRQHCVRPEDGDILVTGATGGVGTLALMLLKRLGYDAWALTGKYDEAPYLRSLGAVGIIERAEYATPPKPIEKERWAAAIDCVGGEVLANVCARLHYGGAVAACGMAAGLPLATSVAPFILRGVTLYGVDSVMCPQLRRELAWQQLAELADRELLLRNAVEISLAEAPHKAHGLSDAHHTGRYLVRI